MTTEGKIYKNSSGYYIRTREYGLKKLSGSLVDANSIATILGRLVRIVGTIDGIYINAEHIETKKE